jgi:hypothetical protein
MGIQLNYEPIFVDDKNTYYNVDKGLRHPPAPQIWLCRSAHWRISVDSRTGEHIVEFINTDLIPGTAPYLSLGR